jgi:hypothetical protein
MAKIIQLSQGYSAIIDDEDFERVIQHKWHTRKMSFEHIYASTRINKKQIFLHRFILEMVDAKIKIDHINGNGLDNQRHNLRLATHAQNMANRKSKKKYKGVRIDTHRKTIKYRVELQHEGKSYRQSFKTEIEAAKAYNEMALKYHGEFANLNII